MAGTTSKIHINDLNRVLRQYSAERHPDVSTDKGTVFFSRPMQQWILVRRKGDTAILEFSSDCPCKNMGVKY
jgi:hypothetical protein